MNNKQNLRLSSINYKNKNIIKTKNKIIKKA